MEERLFWIGIVIGLYAWGTRYGMKAGKLDRRGWTSLWHGIFCAIAGFSIGLVLIMSSESREHFQSVAVGILSRRELFYGLLAGALGGIWGAWNAWNSGDTPKGRSRYHQEDLEWAETFFSALVLASLMMYFVVQAFKIPSGSMKNTLLIGDHLFVNKFVYGIRIPFTGKRVLRLRSLETKDVVVFRFPTEDTQEQHCGSIQYGKDFIKRVIGLPGDEIQVRDAMVYRNGSPVGDEPYVRLVPGMPREKDAHPLPGGEYQRLWESRQLDQYVAGNLIRDDFGPVRVPANSYFMMGDNRDESCDSRFWGPVPDYYVKGKAWIIYWPPSRIGGVH
jgi:signal peptidase I